MTRIELVRDMKTAVGGSFITKQKLCQYMGITNVRHVNKYIEGLEKINGKYYFVPDVATALLEKRN